MGIWDIVLIGAGLAMDAFAVAICKGLQMKKGINVKHLLIIAGFFGGFQALMPCIGYFLGKQFEQYIVSFDHWIAFALLAFLGGKMIWDAVKESRESKCEECGCESPRLELGQLTLMAVATSIDALAIGISFALCDVALWQSVLIIGLITFVICAIGVVLGNRFGTRYQYKAAIGGGVVLILIGAKILLQELGIWAF